MAKAITLHQTAPWNPKLTNPYRTRYATAEGRYFEVKADRLDAPWLVHEVTAEGNWIDNGVGHVAFRLSDVREFIARTANEPAPEGTVRPTRVPLPE